jgi:hypothetical protein
MGTPFYCWRSPSGIVHGGGVMSPTTTCGARVGPKRPGWKVVDTGPITCRRCLKLAPQQRA